MERPARCPAGDPGLPAVLARIAATRAPRGVPCYRPDVYSAAAIDDPYPHYDALRRLGPVTWLAKQRLYALPRYREVKAALSDSDTFRSGNGVAANPLANLLSEGTTLNSDGEVHRDRRSLVAHRLTPRALRAMSDPIGEIADRTVRAAVARGRVDGVEDIALRMPLAVVPDLVGWPEQGRSKLVPWAGATFDFLGPGNRLSLRSLPAMVQMRRFVASVSRTRSVLEGSMAAEVLAAVDEGRVTARECPALLIDYMAPSIDTTASAISSALWLFATNPAQWALLREDPELVPNAVHEVVRLHSPLRAFTRSVAKRTTVSGVDVPAGARVLVLYASANRDREVFTDADRFDITRANANAHVGFGYGEHGCAGQGLARLETQAVLRALLEHVERIELSGAPRWARNNIIHRHATLPITLIPRTTTC